MHPQLNLFYTVIVAIAILWNSAAAQVPTNFPTATVTTYDSNLVAPGYVFLAAAVPLSNHGYYAVMYKNDGTPFWYKQLEDEAYDFKVLPNGYLHYAEFLHVHSWTGGGDALHHILDDSGNLEEIIKAGNGYVPESHEFQMLPNGHVLLHAYYKTQMDMSKIVAGGYPNALISGDTIQELDAQRNVVWQWRTWDNFTLANYRAVLGDAALKLSVINAFHLNTLRLDWDGNLLTSNFSVDVWKINRQTGQIMWRLGGLANQFTFLNVDPREATNHFACHDFHRIENGNFLLYYNGDRQGTRSSRVLEYRLDEVNKTATLVWQYVPSIPIYAWHRGNAQRLPNGNTLIGWGGVTGPQGPACTEVTPSGKVVFELKFNDPVLDSYRAYRFVYPIQSQAKQATLFEVATGNQYTFGGDTGVALDIQSGGGGYNNLKVSREPFAPVYPLFNGTAPLVLPVRVKLTQNSIPQLQGTLSFSTAALGLTNPANLTVYYRPQSDQGLFAAQPTQYNPVTQTLEADISMSAQGADLGEFIFGYPDVAQLAFPPILNEVENYRGAQPYETIAPLLAQTGVTYSVNQQLPICLSWSPKGFAGWYQLQIGTNQNFATPLVDIPYYTDAFFVWTNATPNTTYYYRVSTWNSAGAGDWSAGSFSTVPPSIQVTAPSGGVALRRGVQSFIQWQDNLAENVVIDLYKAGQFARTIASDAPSTGAFLWQVPLDVVPASDYSIRIASATNATLSATNSGPVAIIDAPTLTAKLLKASRQLQLSVTAPGADQATILISTNLSQWQPLQSVPLINGGGTVTDTTINPSRFYRLRVP